MSKVAPQKVFHTLIELALLFTIRAPFWIALHLLPPFRPRPSWTLAQSVHVRLVRALLDGLYVRVGLVPSQPSPASVPDGPSLVALRNRYGAAFDVAPVLPTGKLDGQLETWVEVVGTESVTVPGYWTGERGAEGWPGTQRPAALGEKVVLYLHGGAYSLGTAHPSNVYSRIPSGLLRAFPSHPALPKSVFSLDYRLSHHAPWPAQLLDVVTGWAYLVDHLGFNPEDVVLLGDSTGANLVLALTRHVRDTDHWDVPSVNVLLSPWADLTGSLDSAPNSSFKRNASSDYLSTDLVRKSTKSLLAGFRPEDQATVVSSAYLSPAAPAPLAPDGSNYGGEKEKELFKDWARTYIAAGDAEQLLDHALILRARLSSAFHSRLCREKAPITGIERSDRDPGSKLALVRLLDAPHDIGVLRSFGRQAKGMYEDLAEWLEEAAEDEGKE